MTIRLQKISPPFMGASHEAIANYPAIVGVPYDATASFRKGTRNGPKLVRAVAEQAIETWSPVQNQDLDDISFADLGDLDLPADSSPEKVVKIAGDITRDLLNDGVIPLLIGGEHSFSPGPIRAAFEHYPDLVVVQLDAHADLRQSYENSKYSHACAMRRVLDFLPSERLLQVGIRSGTREEFEEMHADNRLIEGTASALDAAFDQKSFNGCPIWVTYDIDVFDPAEVPGTGTPEAGGLNWQQLDEIRARLASENLVGLDLVEVAPALDPTGITAALAAKLLREWIITLAGTQRLSPLS